MFILSSNYLRICNKPDLRLYIVTFCRRFVIICLPRSEVNLVGNEV